MMWQLIVNTSRYHVTIHFQLLYYILHWSFNFTCNLLFCWPFQESAAASVDDHCVTELSSKSDISYAVACSAAAQSITDDDKYHILQHRCPDESCVLPSKAYADSQRKSGQTVRQLNEKEEGGMLPSTVPATLAECNSIAYPNIFVILQILPVIPVTTASVERANSSLKFVKTALRSSMTNTRLNALTRLFVHRDIDLDLDKIINDYARAHPRRMQLSRPFGYEETED